MIETKLDTPSAPTAGLTLFNSEDQSDLVFIVTVDSNSDEKWRFPAHSFILRESSPVLRELVLRLNTQKNLNCEKPVVNIQCKPEIFYMLMSYIYLKEVDIGAVANGIGLLKIALKFMIIDLSQLCVDYIRCHLSEDNVVLVSEALYKIRADKTNSVSRENLILDFVKDGNNNFDHQDRLVFEPPVNDCLDNSLNELAVRCYNFIDEKAEKVLKSDNILKLDKIVLKQIVSRDSLNLSSESLIFHCLDRWATCQCQKNRVELVAENKINFLGDLIYSVRYLLMSEEEFMRGPYLSDLLPEYDRETIRLAISQQKTIVLPSHLKSYKLDKPRKFIKPTQAVKPQPRYDMVEDFSARINEDSPNLPLARHVRKKSPLKKILNGLGGVMICVIQLLD